MKNPFKKATETVFFWQKIKEKNANQRSEAIIRSVVKYLPEIKALMRNENASVNSEGQVIGEMYDFYKNFDHSRTDAFALRERDFSDDKPKDERTERKPVDVMVELETVPTPFNLEGLDEKISTLQDKTKLLNQRYAKEQIEGLIKRLQNRKKYQDEHEFYNSFPNTTDEAIDKLLAKYKLEINTSDLFIPTFPADAIAIMKKYTEVTEKITTQRPVFYVIAEEKDFSKKREKLDPILLVQSPFGFYWQILGAWDKEMLLLSEL